jgi:hypothetical protein
MMNRMTVALAGLLGALAAQPVSAQVIGQYNQPVQPYAPQPVSPYLNLFRGGAPGINYYGTVLPQIQTERYIQQQQVLAAQQQVLGTGTTVTMTTGHPTRFLSYNQYFLTQGGGATPGTGPQTFTGGVTANTAVPQPARLVNP